MTGKVRTIYMCQSCGYQSSKWLGRCPECEQWSSFVEERLSSKGQRQQGRGDQSGATPVAITRVSADEGRLPTGIGELDRVLGGGVLPGMVVLVGRGSWHWQISHAPASGWVHESRRTGCFIRLWRGVRQDPPASRPDQRLIRAFAHSPGYLRGTNFGAHRAVATPAGRGRFGPDSVFEQFHSGAGSISQVREVTARLVEMAKTDGIATFLVGHVTKDGSLAGPKVLEHMVDCVLYFEGEASHTFRILRAVKNRFGSINEIGVFEMAKDGLHEVRNPSQLFLQRASRGYVGVGCGLHPGGYSPLLIEVQALASPSPLAIPRRVATGFDVNRVALLIAILEKRVGLHLHGEDVYLNIAGGIRVTEPAVDLGVATAIASELSRPPHRGPNRHHGGGRVGRRSSGYSTAPKHGSARPRNWAFSRP